MNSPREKPRLLDLFSGAGGAAVGYARAGFEVVGVDHVSQPNYPFEFVQADAIWALGQLVYGHSIADAHLADFAAIHASPPCQAYVGLASKDGRHPRLIEPTRELLEQTGLPYVIENVELAPLIDPVILCGSMFGLGVRRHRKFETNWPLLVSPCFHGTQNGIRAYYGKKGELVYSPRGDNVQKKGRKPIWRGSVQQAPADMGIDWMTWDELREAIPPAYTETIGAQLLAHINSTVAAGASR